MEAALVPFLTEFSVVESDLVAGKDMMVDEQSDLGGQPSK